MLLISENINKFRELEHRFYNSINLGLITRLVFMSFRNKKTLNKEEFVVGTQNVCRR
jgi:hypothetical protein